MEPRRDRFNMNKLDRKVIRILKKRLTKAELKNIRDMSDHWYIFDEAYESK